MLLPTVPRTITHNSPHSPMRIQWVQKQGTTMRTVCTELLAVWLLLMLIQDADVIWQLWRATALYSAKLMVLIKCHTSDTRSSLQEHWCIIRIFPN